MSKITTSNNLGWESWKNLPLFTESVSLLGGAGPKLYIGIWLIYIRGAHVSRNLFYGLPEMLRFPVWLGDYCMPDEAGTFTAPMKFELLRCLDGFRKAICGTIRLTNIGHCTALIQPRYVGLLGASTGLFNWHNAAAQWVEHSMDSTEKDLQNDDDSCWQILSPEHATFLCLVAVRKTGGCSVKRRHHQQLYLEGTMTAMDI